MRKKANPMFNVDCIFIAMATKKQVIVDRLITSYYRCLANAEDLGPVVLISCGKDCPFYKKRG